MQLDSIPRAPGLVAVLANNRLESATTRRSPRGVCRASSRRRSRLRRGESRSRWSA